MTVEAYRRSPDGGDEVTTLDEIIRSHFSKVQSGRQGEPIGPSGVHTCYRQQAYRAFGAEITDVLSADAADIGTLIHMGVSSIVAQSESFPDVEPDVEVHVPGLPRSGNADFVDWGRHVVVDVKTMGGRAWQARMDVGEPYPSHWDQANIYAYGLNDMRPGPWKTAILMANRDTGQFAYFEREADLDRARSDVERMSYRHITITNAIAAAGSPEDFDREGDGPGNGFPCDWCPYLSQCWPTGADGMTPQALVAAAEGDAEIEKWAQQVIDARLAEKEAKDRKMVALSYLSGLTGRFGQFKITLVGGKPKGLVVDTNEAVRVLREHDLDVPMMDGGVSARYPRVSRVGQ